MSSRIRIEDKAAPPPSALEDNDDGTLTDSGNKKRFIAAFAGTLAFVPEKGVWRKWTGTRWRDDNSAAMQSAELIAEALIEASALQPARPQLLAHAKRTSNVGGLRAMVSLAETSELAIPQNRWDADPELLGVRNGVINLRTGELLDPDPQDYISKYTSMKYDPDARCPRWRDFLHRIMDGDDEMIAFLRRVAGYSLLGHNHERVLFILHGSGANGKSKFLEALQGVMGDYAISTPVSTLMVKRSTGVPNDVARLAGARMVTSIESEKGHKFSEALVKSLTGNDRISARYLFKEFFDFTPIAKIFIGTNHKPEVRGTDAAIWDRLVLIPFNVTIPRKERDFELGDKLRKERRGIFNWMFAGCLEWQKAGLQRPDIVIAATNEYRHDMDVFGRWFEERCVAAKDSFVFAAAAYKDYVEWCEAAHEYPLTLTAFGNEVTNRGVRKRPHSKGIRYLDLNLRQR